MQGFEYRSEYADHDASRTALRAFIDEVHGLDLTLWEERVGWDPGFVPFSFFDEHGVAASTCIYTTPMLVRGSWRKVAQISSVGTRTSLRRRGLNAELTRRALDWARATGHENTFLFSDDDATLFYGRQGFTERAEWQHRIRVGSTARPAYRVLDFDRDEDLIRRLVESREPVSHELGAKVPMLELFHLLYANAGELRYLEGTDVIAAVECEDTELVVYDLIAPALPRWSEVEAQLVDPAIRSVSFAVTPDRLGLDGAEPVEDRSSRLHLLEHEDLCTGRVIVPFTAHA